MTLLLNSDEEVGSPVSRAITERLAPSVGAVLVLEPAQGLAYKTARKGVGNYASQVTGVAAHAGVDFETRRTRRCWSWRGCGEGGGFTDLRAGRDGESWGDWRRDAVECDCRATRGPRWTCGLRRRQRCGAGGEDVSRAEGDGQGVPADDHGRDQPAADGAEARDGGSIRRRGGWPRSWGLQLDEAATGGGSDGNFTAALGVATLDGMGAVGEGAHAGHESIVVEHLVPRTALLAGLIAAA